MGWNDRREVKVLIGKTLTKIEQQDDEEIFFYCNDGIKYRMFHEQDCCEYVSVEDISGNLSDIIGSPILLAEVVSNSEEPKNDEWDESHTWTYYKFATLKGYITIRWYGTSNGYYSESVEFEEVTE